MVGGTRWRNGVSLHPFGYPCDPELGAIPIIQTVSPGSRVNSAPQTHSPRLSVSPGHGAQDVSPISFGCDSWTKERKGCDPRRDTCHRDAASLARATGHAVEDSADGAGGAAAHLYRFDLLGRDARNLGDDGVAYGGVAALGYLCLSRNLRTAYFYRRRSINSCAAGRFSSNVG